ncbi:MAG: chemotaxis protein CheA, partial [Gemmatimonadaceae bacterium]
VVLLFDAADTLEHAIESAGNREASALDVSSLVGRLAERSRRATPPRAARPMVVPAGEGVAVHIRLQAGTILPGARAQLIVSRARSLGTVHGVAPDEATLMADDFDGAFALRIETTASNADVERGLRAAGFIDDIRFERAGAPVGVPNEIVEASPENGARFDAAWGGGQLTAPLQRYVRIDLRRLDDLMNLVGELMIARGRLSQAAAPYADPQLDEAIGETSRLISEVQDGVLGGRMVPVWQVFDRFPRVVRDAARTLGKDVEFVVEGREIELDRSLLEQIADPLVHLLRNAVDHGIEGPAQRATAGKTRSGRLTLSATRERSAVVIRVSDDGRGVDRARVLEKAKGAGLIDAEREELSDDDILRLIARPGFSTADRVTELSGRGVGIDAVISRVRALGGVVELRSTSGRGTSFSLRLPVTLAVIPALLARTGDETYALPLTHVTETLQLRRGEVRTVRGREVIVLREEVLPLLRLDQVVGAAGRAPEANQVVVLELADRRAALVVDQLLGQQEIVVKPFDAVRGAFACFNGATIMGDGSPALILEVSGLLQE